MPDKEPPEYVLCFAPRVAVRRLGGPSAASKLLGFHNYSFTRYAIEKNLIFSEDNLRRIADAAGLDPQCLLDYQRKLKKFRKRNM